MGTGTGTYEDSESIPTPLSDIELLDWTGRAILDNKRGVIAASTPAILKRLNISNKHWIGGASQFERLHRKTFGGKRAHLIFDTS